MTFLSKSLFTASALVFLTFANAGLAYAQEGSAKEFLEAIYKNYEGQDAPGLAYQDENAKLYFDATLTKLFEKDRQEAMEREDGGRLDADPFVNAQEFDISGVSVKIDNEAADKTKGVASFRRFGKPYKVMFDLSRTQTGWRISNIGWPGTKETLRSLLLKSRD